MERMTAAQYRAHIQGKQNRSQGAAFEDTVEASCGYYQRTGEAFIEKTPEPMKPIQAIDRSRGIFKAVYTKAAQPDYKGTLEGGRSVVFDAKSTTQDRIKQDVVTPEQWDALNTHEAMGAWCFVLVSLGLGYYRVPWADWKTMRQKCGHKYMNAEDLAQYAVEYRDGAIRFLSMTTGSRKAIDEFFGVK